MNSCTQKCLAPLQRTSPLQRQLYPQHTYNNPVKYTDPSGHWLDTALDIISVGADIVDIKQNGLNWGNGIALAVDVVSVAVPMVTGGGAVIRAISKADNVGDAIRTVSKADNIGDIIRIVSKTDDVGKIVSKSDDIVDLYRAVDNAEYADIVSTGIFQTVPQGMDVKQFWHSADDAFEFIERSTSNFSHFYSNNVIQASIPRAVYDILPNCSGFKFF